MKNLSFCMVDARVGGGTISIGGVDLSAHGLSPRGRGNRHSADSDHSCTGSIPAWAGEPSLRRLRPLMHWVYPRVGGGTSAATPGVAASTGLSPRGRGNPIRHLLEAEPYGSIPAWAGEPTVITPSGYARRVYPRVGGGTLTRALPTTTARGLSPRGRGNHPRSPCSAQWLGRTSRCQGRREIVPAGRREGQKPRPPVTPPWPRGLWEKCSFSFRLTLISVWDSRKGREGGPTRGNGRSASHSRPGPAGGQKRRGPVAMGMSTGGLAGAGWLQGVRTTEALGAAARCSHAVVPPDPRRTVDRSR